MSLGHTLPETQDERRERVRRWSQDRETCQTCGLFRINVRHEPDPDNAPEGRDWYEAIRHQMHPFVPSGTVTK